MNLAIVGSRDLHITSAVLDAILVSHNLQPDVIISGGARGIDRCVEQYAAITGTPMTIIYPDYTRYGKCAPLVRNKHIVSRSGTVLAIWDGNSKGTKFTLDYAKAQNVPVIIHLIDGVDVNDQ